MKITDKPGDRSEVTLPPEALRPTGSVHGGALATALAVVGIAAARHEAAMCGLQARFLRPVRELVIDADHRVLGEGAITQVDLYDHDGQRCVWGLVRLIDTPAMPPRPSQELQDQATNDDIPEPWRRLLGLTVTPDATGETCSMKVRAPADVWWAGPAYVATFVDGPGALLASERAAGAEFVTSELSLELARPLGAGMPAAASGSVLTAGRRMRTFVTAIESAGEQIGVGSAVYHKIR